MANVETSKEVLGLFPVVLPHELTNRIAISKLLSIVHLINLKMSVQRRLRHVVWHLLLEYRAQH